MITIQTNSNGRLFLVFDTSFDLDNNPDFQESMFNAVFIKSPSLDETIAILNQINPITSRKCCYKPLFVLKKHEGQLGEYAELVDGYAYEIDEKEMAQKTEDILAYLEEIKIQRIVDDLSSANLFFIRLLRFFISRKRTRLTPVLREGSNLGYVLPILHIFFRLGLFKHKEYIIFMQTMYEKGYLQSVKFLNKVYLCPHCMHSHLLYVETCPKCGSSNIKSEEVIHHYRCANISPESAYNFGGQLRCPKCHQMLRHIGVDYDRPSTVYTCESCTNNFLQPRMTVICTNCSKVSDVSALVPINLDISEITEKGKRELVSTSAYTSIYTEFYDNYLEYEHFTNRLRLLAQQVRCNNALTDLSVIRLWLLDATAATKQMKTEFISYICETFRYNNISSANNMLYIKYEEYMLGEQAREEFDQKLRECVKKLSAYIQPGEIICYARASYRNGDEKSIDDFMESLDFVADVPDIYFEYDEKGRDENGLRLMSDAGGNVPAVSASQEEPTSASEAEETPRKKPVHRKAVVWLILVLLLLMGGLFLFMNFRNSALRTTPLVAAPDSASLSDSNVQETAQEVSPAVVPLVKEQADGQPAECVEGRHYVVVASFKTQESAQKQVEYLQGKIKGDFRFSVYRNDKRYIVSPFDAESRESCSQFVVEHREQFPGAWIL